MQYHNIHRIKTRGVRTYKFISAEKNNQEVRSLLKIGDSKYNRGMAGINEAHSSPKRAKGPFRLAGLGLGILP